MRCPRPLIPAAAALVLASAVRVVGTAAPPDFNREILPILADACFHCHGPDPETREADLRLDQRDGLFRSRHGVDVVVAGKPDESDLFVRVTSSLADERMPPPEATRTLKADEVDRLRRWIEAGAPWSAHWAFSPPVRPAVPRLAADGLAAGVRHPIDAFVRARLAREGLAPAPEADPATLLRRLSLDLTGLPPSRDELAAFLADSRPDAYEREVDRLLASPHYGERWAWDWLDLARYADTNGFQGDPERTMWPWRDWVVRALNANLPFDRFSIEQLAGDLLPGATRDQRIASGFHRNTMFNGEGGRIAEETRVENVFDRVETTATVWLGLTFSCARCHDHKYDPITQRDYYALFDVFNQMSETGKGEGGGQIAPVLDVSTEEEASALARARERVEAVAAEVERFERVKFPRPDGRPLAESPDALRLPGNLPVYLAKTEPAKRGVDALLEAIAHFRQTDPDAAYAAVLDRLLAAVRARQDAAARITRVMIMDQIEKPRATFVLTRGSYENPTTTQVFGALPAVLRPPGGETESTGRLDRLGLARWLVSPANPLAARAFVNRAWQAFFGVGFVRTAEDFGVQSEPPSHPELLDWLAVEFIESGWDMKALHRAIVLSATYRQRANAGAGVHERDPENRLLARGARFRLPSWMIRDQALAAAGLLESELGGPSVRPYQPAGVWEEATFGKKTYVQDQGAALYRRSLYVFWRRIVGPTTFFDAGARQVCTVRLARTNTPMHALVTLNDPAYVEAARVLAQRVLAEEGDRGDDARLASAFRHVTARRPDAVEAGVLRSRLSILRRQYGAEPDAALRLASSGEARRPPLEPAEHAAWTALCSLLLNLDETLSKE